MSLTFSTLRTLNPSADQIWSRAPHFWYGRERVGQWYRAGVFRPSRWIDPTQWNSYGLSTH